MAIGDIPKFPEELKPRGNKLIRMLEENSLSGSELLENVLATLGAVKIGANGLKIAGDFGSFEISASDFKALAESMEKMLDYLPSLLKRLKDRELYIKAGDEVTKIKIGIPPKKIPSYLKEVEKTESPVIEMPARSDSGKAQGFLFNMFASYIGDKDDSSSGKMIDAKIRRADELVGWLGEGWDFLVQILEIATPAVQLTTKETLDKLGESYAAFWDELFRRCGV
ncbi:MAG: hypothetical protein JXA49_01575 [Actinobacteria bacterium]|nr:hypothetical protein [Actinomycetota bacterium]